MSEYDREASIMRRRWSTSGCCAMEKKKGVGGAMSARLLLRSKMRAMSRIGNKRNTGFSSPQGINTCPCFLCNVVLCKQTFLKISRFHDERLLPSAETIKTAIVTFRMRRLQVSAAAHSSEMLRGVG